MNTTHIPESHLVPNPPEKADLAHESVTPVIHVDLDKWADAWVAFFDALGVEGLTANHLNGDDFTVTADGMSVTHCQRVPGVDAIAVGDDEFAEWGWPIRIEVIR